MVKEEGGGRYSDLSFSILVNLKIKCIVIFVLQFEIFYVSPRSDAKTLFLEYDNKNIVMMNFTFLVKLVTLHKKI